MHIDYQRLIDKAMLDVVRQVLTILQYGSELDNMEIYISFYTDHPEVILSEKVKELYPKEITIVLQHQFRKLVVHENYFSVELSFGHEYENIYVPFEAMTYFADTRENFALKLNNFPKRHDDLHNIDSNKYNILSPKLSDFDIQNKIIKEEIDNKPEEVQKNITSIHKIHKKKTKAKKPKNKSEQCVIIDFEPNSKKNN